MGHAFSSVAAEAVVSLSRQPAAQTSGTIQVEALRYILAHTREQLSEALRKVSALESMSARSELYAQVGLHPNSPDFVVKAVQKAYRRALHPDTKRPEHRDEAERQFKQAEMTFALISAARA